MANPNLHGGLSVLSPSKGIGVPVNAYYLPSSYGTAMYIGDPAVITGTSNTAVYNGWKPGCLPEVNKATAGDGNKTTGVVVNFEIADYLNPQTKYHAASTEQIVYLADDPDTEFEIQADTSLAVTDVGLNGVYIFGTASTITGLSGVRLDTGATTALATTATFQLKVKRFSANSMRNDAGNYCLAVVKINNHSFSNIVVGV